MMQTIEPVIDSPYLPLALLIAVLLVQLLTLHRLRRARQAPVAAIVKRPTMEANCSTGDTVNPESKHRVSEKGVAQAVTQGAARSRLRFIVDSLFLAASYRYVCSGPDEAFHYATGAPVDKSTFYLSRILPVKYSEQSLSGVRVADASNIDTLARLDDWGLPLLAHVHSHPTFGAGGTTPSAIDRKLCRRLAQGGYVAVGIVFSRDGHLRFYIDESIDFTVEIRGKHVRKVEENVYVLESQLVDGDLPSFSHSFGIPG